MAVPAMRDDEPIFDDDDEMDWDGSSDDDILVPLKDKAEVRAILRRDLRAVKNAGFKVGYLGTLEVSCRISRLGISEDAVQAWNVSRLEYLVLLIRYRQRTATSTSSFMEQVVSEALWFGCMLNSAPHTSPVLNLPSRCFKAVPPTKNQKTNQLQHLKRSIA